MSCTRRKFCAVSAAVAALGAPSVRAAGPYPGARAVTVIVPFAAGGNTDIVARLLGNGIAARLEGNVVIDNRAGAAGNIGSAAAARAQPDGYTYLYTTASTHAINPAIYKSLPYDPSRDFVPVAVTVQVPIAVVVSASSGIKTMAELAARIKADPDKYSYGSNGSGTSSHIASFLLAKKIGAPNLLHVPYKQGPQVMADLMGGQLTFAMDAWSVVGQYVRSGRLVALAVSGKQRLAAAPDVPTVAEVLGGDYDVVTWNALFAPTGTPAPILAQMHKAVTEVVRQPDLKARFEKEGLPVYPPMTLAETSQFLRAEIVKWNTLVKQAGVVAD